VDKRAGFCFSDATNPDRLILFEKGDISSLISDISKKFCRKRVFVREIREYTEKETIFLERHMKEVLKQLENQRLIDVENLKADGEKRRRGTFPSDAIVSFNSDVIDCQS
jgi:chromatin segregation and condensation protein Rec8/ScpA/Scc1 (kleisin family)